MSFSRAISLVLMALSIGLVAGPASAARKEPTVQERFDQGQKYARRGYYVKALEEFNRIRNYHRDDPLAIQAELAIADVYFRKAEWDQARLAYEDFMRMHPRHEDLDYVVYRLGLTAYKKAPRIAARDQTWTRQAVNAWAGFEKRYPDSEHMEEVTELLTRSRNRLARKEFEIGAFYVKREAWPAVQARMERVLQKYPSSSSVAEALGLLALAQWQQGQSELALQTASRLKAEHPDSRALRKLERDAPELL